MKLGYAESWLLALLITQLVEVPIYIVLARIGVWRALSLSLITHPVVWFAIAPLATSAGMTMVTMLVVAELFAWLAEAALLRHFDVSWRRAISISLAANAASVAAGELCRTAFGVP